MLKGMITVYALKNLVNEELYVGMTNCMERRLGEHNAGKNRYTKAFRPWKLFYTGTFPDYMTARKREKYLKSAAGKRYLKTVDTAGKSA